MNDELDRLERASKAQGEIEALHWVMRLNPTSQQISRKIETIKQTIEDNITVKYRPEIKIILEACDKYFATQDNLTRNSSEVRCRVCKAYIIRHYYPYSPSLTELGKLINRNYTTVIYYLKIKKRLSPRDLRIFETQIETILAMLGGEK